MCNLCSINHFSEDEDWDEDDEHESSGCVHRATPVPSEQDLASATFTPAHQGSSF